MQVEFHRLFKKTLLKLDKKNILKFQDINDLIDDFLITPDKSSYDNKHIKSCSRYKNLWQIRVNRDYRILYLKFDDYLEFRNIGTHNYIEKLVRNC